MSRGNSSWKVLALGVAGSFLLAACGTSSATPPPSPTAVATQVADGHRTAEVENHDVDPITDSPAPQLPVTVESFDGVDVTIDDVSRIVTVDMYGTLTETVFSLGLGDNVVGRDSSSDFPAADGIPNVTVGGHDLSAEAILDLEPTVVLTDSTIGPHEVQKQLRQAGIPVVYFDPDRTLDGIPDLIRDVAATLGVPDAGEQLIERTEAELADALKLAEGVTEPPRIAFLYMRGTAGIYLMGGPGSGADDLIHAVGGIDVGTDIGLERPFTTMTSEAMISASPDVILVMSDGLESVGGVEKMLQMPGIAQTPAAAHKRIIDMNDTELLTFGARTGQTVRALAEALYDHQ